jgi:hypothetical protein
MTEEAKRVFEVCGFRRDVINVRMMEQYLARASSERIIEAIEKFDPDGAHDVPWFRNLFHGYIKSPENYGDGVEFDDKFWQAYDILTVYCDELHSYDLKHINEVKADVGLLIRCAQNSKVKKVPYVAAVWRNEFTTRAPIENNINMLSVDIPTSTDVQTREVIGG